MPSLPPANVLDPLCLAIGHFLIAWSFIDSAATVCVNAAVGKTTPYIETPEAPYEFKRRIKKVRQCLRHHPGLREWAESGKYVLDRAMELSAHRDFLVHGTFAGYDETVLDCVKFNKLDRSGNRTAHTISSYKTNPEKIALLRNECVDIGAEFIKLARRFQELFI
jgi:hypothetical protein